MFSRNLITVWIGIAVVSGMFLVGQETWPPAGLDLSGLYKLEHSRKGGSCGDGVLPGLIVQTVQLNQQTTGAMSFIIRADGSESLGNTDTAMTGQWKDSVLDASGTGKVAIGTCVMSATWTMTGSSTVDGWTGSTSVVLQADTPETCTGIPDCEGTFTTVSVKIGTHRKASEVAWTRIDDPKTIGKENFNISASAIFNGIPYFGTRKNFILYPSSGGEVWRWSEATSWERVHAIPGPADTEISSMVVHNGQLYAGSWEVGQGQGFDLWRTADGTTWEPVTTSGFWNDPAQHAVTSMISYNGRLYIGVFHPSGEGNEVWREQGSSYEKILPLPGNDPTIDPTDDKEGYGRCNSDSTSFAIHGGTLYLGTESVRGCEPPDHGAWVIRLDNEDPPRWSVSSTEGLGNMYNHNAVLVEYNTRLYVTTWNFIQGVDVRWYAGGTSWPLIANDGFGGRAGFSGLTTGSGGGLLFFGTVGKNGGGIWATQGGDQPRDFTLVIPPYKDGANGYVAMFEVGGHLLVYGAPSVLVWRSDCALADEGTGCIRTAMGIGGATGLGE